MKGHTSGHSRDGLLASNAPEDVIAPRLPVIVMVLAATAIPIEWRPLAETSLSLSVNPWDVVANVAGYVPVGVVLASIGAFRGVAAAAIVSGFAESMQLFMVHRDPSLVDVYANVVGAIIGVVLSQLIWPRAAPTIRLTRWRGLGAGAAALALVAMVWTDSGVPLNDRGLTMPGVLEAHWKLDEESGRIAHDSSGNGLDAAFSGNPARMRGKLGGAVRFDGIKDYLDAGVSPAYRLVGSMTVSAWIKPAAFPIDDATIVSDLEDRSTLALGWQLDTTIDRGPRTIGFKLADSCTKIAARYGATPLVTNTWYHVAAVFDANERRMDVYLNGVLDNGALIGKVPRMRRSSRLPLFVGRRSDVKGFEYSGTLDDMQIHSFALTAEEIITVMQGGAVIRNKVATSPGGAVQDQDRALGNCAWVSEPADGRLPGTVAAIGVLAAVLCLALVPGRLTIAVLGSAIAGIVVFAVSTATLPYFNMWAFPLTSAAGGVAVALSTRRTAQNSR